MDKTIKMTGIWNGWAYKADEGVLFDEGNNHYWINEIKSLFYLREWHGSREGNMDRKKILFLRDELEKRIKQQESLKKPRVIIEWGETREVINHPYSEK